MGNALASFGLPVCDERAVVQGAAGLSAFHARVAGVRDSLPFDYAALRRRFHGAWMVNNGYDRAMAIDAVASGRAVSS